MAAVFDGVRDLCANPSEYFVELGDEMAIALGERGVEWRCVGDHAEVEFNFNEGRYLLCTPLTHDYLARSLKMGDLFKNLFGGFELRQCRVRSLRHREYGFNVEVALCRVVDGEPLRAYLRRASEVLVQQLYITISTFEDDLRSCDISFDGLSGSDLVVADNGLLYPTTLRGLRMGCGDESYLCCDDLRRWVRDESGFAMPLWVRLCEPRGQMLRRPLVEGHLWCGAPHEERIAVRDKEGYGFVDMENCVVVESRFRSVTSFGEGRAVVESDRGYGLIDVWGNFVIEDIYDDMSYSVASGVTVAKLDGLWGRFNYRGELISPFSQQYPREDILNLAKNV